MIAKMVAKIVPSVLLMLLVGCQERYPVRKNSCFKTNKCFSPDECLAHRTSYC